VYTVKRGDRIAQAVLCPVAIPTISIVDELNKTDRGSNGFGSSGV
jgi:dUTP pyrophosphatase